MPGYYPHAFKLIKCSQNDIQKQPEAENNKKPVRVGVQCRVQCTHKTRQHRETRQSQSVSESESASHIHIYVHPYPASVAVAVAVAISVSQSLFQVLCGSQAATFPNNGSPHEIIIGEKSPYNTFPAYK